jgi:hypothetical protein
MFSNLFFITLPNIEKYFLGIHFPKKNYFPANKRGLIRRRIKRFFLTFFFFCIQYTKFISYLYIVHQWYLNPNQWGKTLTINPSLKKKKKSSWILELATGKARNEGEIDSRYHYFLMATCQGVKYKLKHCHVFHHLNIWD